MALYTQSPAIFDDANRPASSKPSMLRAILPSRGHKRSPSAGDALLARSKPVTADPFSGFLPADHPHAQPLGERAHNRDAAGGSRPQRKGEWLHQKTKSSVSLKGLIGDREKKDHHSTDEGSLGRTMKKVKSSTSLSALLKRSQRGRKGEIVSEPKNKENQRPKSEVTTPIWAQFATQPLEDTPGGVSAPENGRSLEEEVLLYTPKQYSPSKQRNFYDYHQPTLAQKPRPKSDYISSGTTKMREMLGQIQRMPSDKQSNPEKYSQNHVSSDVRSSQDSKRNSSRVMAAVSALNAKETENRKSVDSKQIENEFEKLLDARNIPQNMRDKMRALDTSIKADFIQKNRTESSCPNSATSSTFDSAGRRGRKDAGTNSSHGRDKSARSRSRGRSPFSMSRGDLSPSKKHQKSDSTSSTKRPKSIELARPYSSMLPGASASVTSLQAAAHTDTSADPADFIHYLREVQKPELVEVGKLHKLRLLLRNETVSWVDSFIADNGMDEVIQLLYRIMAVEWREDHEDTLLHETLLCLKALCTTSLALQRLTLVAKNLFPALLSMLFDDEKKGPSEFTTRGIIISLLFTYLSTASTQAMSECASEILTYLRDPCPETQQVDFIANIYQPRPYRVWSKEVTNVTKEVFWIFLHHLNVIPIASRDDSIIDQEQDYVKRHFPVPRPPVPAAPYVGGVEWDATNYLAAHLDLMNGLIACQPTREQRNTLREELRASGFEKVMGGSMRTCKEKFYGAVHDCLKTWVSAAREDGWDYRFVREGPEPGSPAKSPTKSPQKKRVEEPPKIALAIDLEKKAPAKEADLDGWI